jgi:hypothetical protein
MPAVKGSGRLGAAQVLGLTLAAAAHWSFGRRGTDVADYGLRAGDIRRQLRDTVRCGIPFSG